MDNLFGFAQPARRPVRPVTGPIDAAPLLAVPPCRPSRAAVERTIMTFYAAGSLTPRALGEALEVPPTSHYVGAVLAAICDARRIMEYRGSVPFSDVARLAGLVLDHAPMSGTLPGFVGGEGL